MQWAEERGGIRSARAMLAGRSTTPRDTNLNPVSSPSAIMSPTEPMTLSLRSPPAAGVANVPRPACR